MLKVQITEQQEDTFNIDVINNIQIAEKADLLKEHTKMAKEVNHLENQTRTVSNNLHNMNTENKVTALTHDLKSVPTTVDCICIYLYVYCDELSGLLYISFFQSGLST